MKRDLRAALLLPLFVLQGCYSHVPVALESVPAGARVRARVSATEAERLEGVLGGERRTVGGVYRGREGAGLLLELPAVTGPTGQRLTQRVSVSGDQVVEIELRRLDRARTYGLVAALTAVGSALAISQFAAARDPESSADPPPVNEILIPLLRWRR
jgi:hypothetical protein